MPRCVFVGDRKAYVGTDHKDDVSVDRDTKERLLEIKKRYGVWYEGNGGDIDNLAGVFGSKSQYEGSWDGLVADNVTGYPMEFMAPLFSNIRENGAVEHFTAPDLTIAASIVKNQRGYRYFDDRSFTASQLTDFLREGSEKGFDFVSMAKEPATEGNLRKFFSAGERLMWPRNWMEYPNKFGKLAKRFEKARNGILKDAKAGVFVVGRDHIKEIEQEAG